MDPYIAYNHLIQAIHFAAENSVPKLKIKPHSKPVPYWTDECARLKPLNTETWPSQKPSNLNPPMTSSNTNVIKLSHNAPVTALNATTGSHTVQLWTAHQSYRLYGAWPNAYPVMHQPLVFQTSNWTSSYSVTTKKRLTPSPTISRQSQPMQTSHPTFAFTKPNRKYCTITLSHHSMTSPRISTTLSPDLSYRAPSITSLQDLATSITNS